MNTIRDYVSLAPYTVYGIGGPARYFADADTPEGIRDLVKFGRSKGVPFFVLGAGSNILVSDEGFPGIVIHIVNRNMSAEGTILTADAGVSMAQAVAASANGSLTGFEWGIGIPGTVGGAVRGNAGCFGGEMKDVVSSILILDTADESVPIRTIPRDACEFGYRNSIFKSHREWIILSVSLALAKGDPKEIQKKILSITRERNEKQDIGTKSCGCIFKNVAWSDAGYSPDELVRHFPEFEAIIGHPNIPASFLIDNAGLKGMRFGKAIISPKHANFFVNEGGVSSEDVRALIREAKRLVRERYGIELREEIQYVGFEETPH